MLLTPHLQKSLRTRHMNFGAIDTNILEPPRLKTRTKLTRSFITTEKVRQKIKNLKFPIAAGPDGIAPKLLKNCHDLQEILCVGTGPCGVERSKCGTGTNLQKMQKIALK